jgi:hemerythrin-like domain-containing protein
MEILNNKQYNKNNYEPFTQNQYKNINNSNLITIKSQHGVHTFNKRALKQWMQTQINERKKPVHPLTREVFNNSIVNKIMKEDNEIFNSYLSQLKNKQTINEINNVSRNISQNKRLLNSKKNRIRKNDSKTSFKYV